MKFSDYYILEKSKQKRKKMLRKIKKKKKLKSERKFNKLLYSIKKGKVLKGADEKIMDSFLNAIDRSFTEIENIHTDKGNVYEVEMDDGSEYLVYKDYQDAKEDAKQSILDLIDDLGPTVILGWQDHLDEEKLGIDLAIDEGNMAYDEPDIYLCNEDPKGEDGDWSDEQRERAKEIAEKRIKEDPIEYLKEIYGDYENFTNIILPYVDLNSLAEYVIRSDGIANSIALYDGNEIQLSGNAVAYRTN